MKILIEVMKWITIVPKIVEAVISIINNRKGN